MILRDYAYEIIELVQRQITDDFEIDVRLVEDMIKDQRLLDIKRSLNSNKGTFAYSSFSGYSQKFELSFVENGEVIIWCGDKRKIRVAMFINNPGSAIIPEMVKFNSGVAFLKLLEKDGDNNEYGEIKIGTRSSIETLGSGRFNTNETVAFYSDGHIFIATTSDTDYVQKHFVITAIFTDPTTASGFSVDTDDYPIGDNWGYIQDYIVKKLVDKIMMPEDRINDSSDEIKKTD